MFQMARIVKPRRPLYSPAIDIHEGPDGLTLRADLPGVTRENLEISVENNVLRLLGKVNLGAEAEGRLVYQEFRDGDFYRSFILGDEVEVDEITAEFDNGVLTLSLPKAKRLRSRRIEVTVPEGNPATS